MTRKRIFTDDEIRKTFIAKCTKVLSDRTLISYKKRLEELLADNVE